MKKFTINCDFGGQMAPFTIYIGKPKEGNHPLDNQAKWLADNRGGTIPGEVMEAVAKLQELAKKNNVSLEELCVYALGTEEEQEELAAEQEGMEGAVIEAPDETDDEEYLEYADDEEGIEEQEISDDIYPEDAWAEEGGHIEDQDLEDEEDLMEEIEHDADDMAGEGGHIEDPELEEGAEKEVK